MNHIAIAGCGVAGLAAAIPLARAGLRVVIYDRLAAPAPLGSGLILQSVGMAVLAHLGLADALRDQGARIDRLFGRAAPSGRVVLDVRYAALGRDACGIGVHRGALFFTLLNAALNAGATLEPRAEIVGVEPLAAGRAAFVLRSGRLTPSADLAIDALGARSPLRRALAPLAYGALWANVPWPEGFNESALEQRYRRAKQMVGVLPIGRAGAGADREASFFWSLRCDEYEAWRRERLDGWKADVSALWPQTSALLRQFHDHDQLIFARYAHATSPPTSRGVVHIGDSWHAASPQLGQGANMALLDAHALTHALLQHKDREAVLSAYARARRFHVRLYQAASFLFTPVYQSDGAFGPWLRDWIAAPLSRLWPAPPLLAGLVAGQVGAPLRAITRRS